MQRDERGEAEPQMVLCHCEGCRVEVGWRVWAEARSLYEGLQMLRFPHPIPHPPNSWEE